MSKFSILIPAFNAATTLPSLIGKLCADISTRHIVVVDDGSRDGTGDVASRLGVTVLRHEANCGKGRALATGFEYLLRHNHDEAVVTMDADLQHRPEDLQQFLDVYEYLRPDVIVGSRSRLGSSMPLARRLSNTITSALVSARTGVRIKDSQCGFRLIARRVLEAVRLESSGYEAETEFLIKASAHGFEIVFVPIHTVYGGERSSMTHWHTTKQFLNVLLKEY
jgi:glycosyltransferase involved in cell wall biosynthesis